MTAHYTATQKNTGPVTGPLVYKIADLAGKNGLLRLSRREIYKQIEQGRLKIVKQGRATLITAAALDDYIKLLEREAGADQ